MAVNPGTKWPTRTTAPTGDYPYASAKDETSPGANDGTPYELARADDIFGMQQALLKAAGIVPSGNADTALASQYTQAILDVALRGGFLTDTGAADAYILDTPADSQDIAFLKEGQLYAFIPDNTNTGGVATAVISGIGATSIKRVDGSNPAAGDLTATETVWFIYDGVNFVIVYTTGDKQKINEGLTFDIPSSANAGIVTLLVASTPITTVDLGTVTVGDIFDIEGMCEFTKGGTIGDNALSLAATGGSTASVRFFSTLTKSEVRAGFAAGLVGAQQVRGKLRVVGSGTLVVELAGLSVGSNSSVAVGAGQMDSLTVRRQ